MKTLEFENWDPLQTKLELEEEVVSAAQKREIKNILKSYTGWYDPFSELIQNALDSVEMRSKSSECPENYKPSIWITINLQDNSLSVCDNGVGLDHNSLKLFLRPNITFKTKGNTRGNKGVGATYLGYGFNYLQISTKTPGFEQHVLIEHGRDWVEDRDGSVPRPKFKITKMMDSNFQDVDTGVSITLKFKGDNIRPKNLSHYRAFSAEQWEYILRIKTALGGIYFERENPKIICVLKVINEKGGEEEKIIEECSYIYPHNIFSKCIDIKDIQQLQMKLVEQGKDPSKMPPKYNKLDGIYSRWNPDEILDKNSDFFKSLNDNERELVKKYRLWAYGFFGYSTKLWDLFNDDIAKLRKGSRILSGGIQMAANFMPQGERITIPLTKNIGHQNMTHCIIHYSNADPDLGRKGFQPELEELGEEIAGIIVKIFRRRRNHLKRDTGAPLFAKEAQKHQWIKSQEEHAESNPLSIKGEGLFMPTEEIPVKSIPLTEQDIVALFNEMLAAGVIRGIDILSTSEHKVYDGIYRIDMKKPYDRYIYDKQKNPLGVQKEVFSEGDVISPPSILEYKYSIDGLIHDFENEEKYPQDINLVIAWEMGDEWEKRYQVVSLLDIDNVQHRPFHGITHEIRESSHGGHVMYAIILSELIEYLMGDFEKVQEKQKKLYGEE